MTTKDSPSGKFEQLPFEIIPAKKKAGFKKVLDSKKKKKK